MSENMDKKIYWLKRTIFHLYYCFKLKRAIKRTPEHLRIEVLSSVVDYKIKHWFEKTYYKIMLNSLIKCEEMLD